LFYPGCGEERRGEDIKSRKYKEEKREQRRIKRGGGNKRMRRGWKF
jgi:hypothetical protein